MERDWLANGDGLLILDVDSGLEWLDLTQSQLSDYGGPDGSNSMRLEAVENALTEAMSPGGRLAGFEFATRDEVLAFAGSAGIDTGTWSPVSNTTPSSTLIALLGNVAGSVGNGSATGWVLGDPGPQYSPNRMSIFAYPGGRGAPVAGIAFTSNLPYGAAREGVWLRRTSIVPEPGGLSALAVVAFCCLASMRRQVRLTRIDWIASGSSINRPPASAKTA